MVVANLPYVERDQIPCLVPEVRCHEPRIALDGGEAGLDYISRLLLEAKHKVLPGGTILTEIGAGQGDAVKTMAKNIYPMSSVTLHRDLSGLYRVLIIQMVEKAVIGNPPNFHLGRSD
jgi:release factor glutamine methyltransferase